MIRLKSYADIQGIWRSGQIAGALLDAVPAIIRPGISSAEVEAFASDFIISRGGRPAFLGYNGYPGAICTSFNEEVVHGIPGKRRLQPGDIISVDVGVDLDGYISDTARTFFVGPLAMPPAIERLMSGTHTALEHGLAAATPGQPLRIVSRAIQQELDRCKLGVIRELSGHGVGFALHEEPALYNFDPGGRRPFLENGMVIAVEPMATLGTFEVRQAADKWTYLTADGSLAAHFEHTMACWDSEVYVLTDATDERARAMFSVGTEQDSLQKIVVKAR